MNHIEHLRFLDVATIQRITEEFGTPVFAYSKPLLTQQAQAALAFPAPFGLTVRYAMKANPNRAIIQMFDHLGLEIDASSGYEAERAILAGIAPEHILITAQELPKNLKELVAQGVQFNACSLHQLELYGQSFPGTSVGVRINPGLGSGHSAKTNVGGPSSSFGIWYEYVDEIKELAAKYNLTIARLHTHIGSGTDPAVWSRAALLSLEQVKRFPDVTTLNLGGGFKVARMHDEIATDLHSVGHSVSDALQTFAQDTGRQLHLEIEPGTFLVANAGSLITTIHDIVNTGEEGYEFLKIDSGMTEILRPNLYGAQHPLVVINNRATEHKKYIVVGHCCESGDLLTPYPGDPDALSPRLMQAAAINDLLVIEGAGAYCAYMSAQNYNSFPLRPEIMLEKNGSIKEVSRRETLQEMLHLESVT